MAARRDSEFKQFYKRPLQGRDKPKVKVAVARKLFVRSFIMLRDQIHYAEFVRHVSQLELPVRHIVFND